MPYAMATGMSKMKAITMPNLVDWPEPEWMATVDGIEVTPGLTTVYLLNDEEMVDFLGVDEMVDFLGVDEIEERLQELHYDYITWGEEPFRNWMIVRLL